MRITICSIPSMGEHKATHIILLALVVVPENLEDLGRSLERDDRLGGGKFEITNWGGYPAGDSL